MKQPPVDDHSVNEHRQNETAEPRAFDLAPLSEREREVLDLALAGLAARAIADRLSLTEATVRSHLSRIYAKLGVAGRVELLAHIHSNAQVDGDSDHVADGAGQGDAAITAPRMHAPTPEPARPLLRVGIVAAVFAIGVGFLFAFLRPDLPPTTDLASVSRLVAEGHVRSLDLRGDILIVETTDGQRLRVDRPDEKSVAAIQSAAINGSSSVRVSSGGDSLATSLAILATAVGPVGVPIVALVLALRTIRRPPEPSSAG